MAYVLKLTPMDVMLMLSNEKKSVLDGAPIQDFPRLNEQLVPKEPKKGWLQIVGECPRCGGPIYGKMELADREEPTTVFTCSCRNTHPGHCKK